MSFSRWAGYIQREPYQSWGSGSAMRVSSVEFAFDSLDAVRAKAGETAEVTRNHEEGIRGAQATAAAIFLARKEEERCTIRDYVEATFGYDLSRSLAAIRPGYSFDVSCQGSVPESIIAFLESPGVALSLAASKVVVYRFALDPEGVALTTKRHPAPTVDPRDRSKS